MASHVKEHAELGGFSDRLRRRPFELGLGCRSGRSQCIRVEALRQISHNRSASDRAEAQAIALSNKGHGCPMQFVLGGIAVWHVTVHR